MIPIHAITPVAEPLSEMAEALLSAMRGLTQERQPHPCGGFTTDDIKWQLGSPFIDIGESIDELVAARLIRFSGFDENADESACSCFIVN